MKDIDLSLREDDRLSDDIGAQHRRELAACRTCGHDREMHGQNGIAACLVIGFRASPALSYCACLEYEAQE